jgi:hypothetical protein
MAITYNQRFDQCKTASELLTKCPWTAGKDGYYLLYPRGNTEPGILTYCDMTTDGGGYMLVARSHPTGSPVTWGWRGDAVGGVKDFSQPYNIGLWKNFLDCNFTSFIFGNRSNINNNAWGPFIYKVYDITNFNTFMTSDSVQIYTKGVIKTTTSIFNSTAFPGMQTINGYATQSHFVMRDCCGPGYGGFSTYFGTAYTGHVDLWAYAGPWGAGSSTDGSGNFIQTTADPKVSGTNQYMIMVK